MQLSYFFGWVSGDPIHTVAALAANVMLYGKLLNVLTASNVAIRSEVIVGSS